MKMATAAAATFTCQATALGNSEESVLTQSSLKTPLRIVPGHTLRKSGAWGLEACREGALRR